MAYEAPSRHFLSALAGAAFLFTSAGFLVPGALGAAAPPVTASGSSALSQNSDKSKAPTLLPTNKGSGVLRGGASLGSKPATGASTTGAPSTAGSPAAASKGEATPAAEAADETAGGNPIVRFIKGNSAWIVAVLGIAIAVVVAWTLLGARKKTGGGAGAGSLAELGLADEAKKPSGATSPKRFSSTRIEAGAVSDRAHRSVKTTEVETDREYALVVDEESLKMPPLPEDAETQSLPSAVDATKIVKLIEAKNYRGAYGEYVKVVEGGAPVRFKEDFEESLGSHFVKAKDYEKAAKVLEHFVGTRAVRDLRPEVYFNLAYAHFMQKTFAKSQRFFRLFVEHEKNPVYVERARKILARIESTANRN